MRNIIFKVSSLVVLMICLSVLSANAQTIQKYQGLIPFDFQVANTTYQAGEYNIFVDRKNEIAPILTIRNADYKVVGQWAAMTNGQRVLEGKTVLMFDRFGDRYILRRMVSQDFGLNAPKSKVKRWIASKNTQPDETVAILFSR